MRSTLPTSARAALAISLLEANPRATVVAAAARSGISTWTVYRAWRAKHPGTQPRGQGIGPTCQRERWADTRCLRAVLLDHVPAVGEVSALVLFAAVRADFGTVGDRRLWRALCWQVAAGAVVHVRREAGRWLYRKEVARP